ncbi:Nuclear RNA export factor 2 [Trachymyrmex zeteki]|uniref:Nuclear RNA export factor 2 n=1 Tax=Mycetomoellerius zeteki TaxID=64791 RepID=A0A151X6Z6_9HYME|nr:PREDICTED: nuclear RNA export factor 2 [Trachymyrmex zeteki]XP_018302502.1 PREDICTED: nuclear RNA export factor 2 [Trachymyrmex zeteki]XP_018302503.1 PREDICTED: nuclear RNA export factor 2 [Trachymyrmex zeteki]XP_018302504.1 PREDICTED: nuclear RNA export factor 2 [Trachymyrmex zeteki]XP_018302505.1 PREDICTED: nuclear RNA export factor 2 [Trachymyrmex zeteki]KYQ56094.1 Nuclear RNA export factor 2 [Trachymyrmex zeteki]
MVSSTLTSTSPTTSTTTSAISQASWEPHRITYIKPTFDKCEKALANRTDLWHKFIVFNGAIYRRTDVLRAIVITCEPALLIPIMYTVEDKNTTFLAKCTINTIENLVKQGLTITLPTGQDLYIDIVLGFLGAHELRVNTNKIIADALQCRYEPIRKVFNLDDFENERALGSIFCPISIPKIFDLVLRCSRTSMSIRDPQQSKLAVRELSLRYNKLTAVILFDKFFNFHLTKLDLRHNQILDVEYLRYFCEFKISELWLDGNPLCTKYTNSQDYIQAVKNVFPHLQILDGIVIGMENKFVPSIQSYYLGNGTKIPLIRQFVKHFFALYDQDDRIVMNGLYDKSAFYSMSLGNNITNHIHKEIVKTFSMNRNWYKISDCAKCHEFLFRGPEKIITALQKQPPTIHYLKTFCIDLLYEEDNCLAVSMQGLFAYRLSICPPMLFNRTFIITRKEDNEYCIINDLCYIDGIPLNATNEIRFDPRVVPKFIPTVLSVTEKEQLLRFLRELTTMNIRYCYKYLQEAEWNIKIAITTFMKNYSVNDVPSEAFQ